MEAKKRNKLEAAGWKVGTAAEFLGLTLAEELFVNMKLDMAERVRELRKKAKMSQTTLAKKLGSSQSRVAKIEAADNSVSLDLLMRSLITLGDTRNDLAAVICSPHRGKKRSTPTPQTKKKAMGVAKK